jgi:hypothetical protein
MANPELTREPSPFDTKAHALVRKTQATTTERRSATRKMARGLGWFSIGLGLLELLASRQLARAVGLQGREPLLMACGVREIVSGIGLLTARTPRTEAAFMWSRVAGDGLDLSTLAAAAVAPRPHDAHPIAAMVAVAGVAAMDVACARTLQHEAHAERQVTDYSDRSGVGAAPEQMRGAALENFQQPDDMRVSVRTGSETLH